MNQNKKIISTTKRDDVVSDIIKLKEATYKMVDLSEEDFDDVPNMDDDKTKEGEPPVPEFDKEDSNVETSELDIEEPKIEEPQEDSVDTIQNEIIKHNIEAMKGIHSQIENLTNMVQTLNTKFGELNADVEEVREPSNVEKLMTKKDISYPYYFNLNDFWNGNWFEENYGKSENGIRELPDGTYIANFDDLPKTNLSDLDKSFDI